MAGNSRRRTVWISSWDRACGIADYSRLLLPAIQAAAGANFQVDLLSLDEFRTLPEILIELKRREPALVHFQHEYGLYGGKNPPAYWFPGLLARARCRLPNARFVATAHTVLSPTYRFPLEGKGLQRHVRWLANQVLLSWLRRTWFQNTWGGLDATIVHSRYQAAVIRESGCRTVEVIPHFVPESTRLEVKSSRFATVLVFGFITPEKGQDVAVEALSKLPDTVKLVLAGGVRRPADQKYLESLERRIDRLKLRGRVTITGFVRAEQVQDRYREADLVLAPFRETSGSGSLAQALARACPILCSDLLLNREISERIPGAVEFFETENPEDCALKIADLLNNPNRRAALAAGAGVYADQYRPAAIAQSHLSLYQRLLGE